MSDTKQQSDAFWYSVFRDAILETRREQVVPRIDQARNAICSRMSELQSARATSREKADLGDALRYLAILSQHIGRDTGNILWE